MARIVDHIRAVDPERGGAAIATAPPKPDATESREAGVHDGGVVPWLWIAAWLMGWGILIALAAWWVGAEGVRPRDIWVWIGVWVVGGLAVAALMVRMAAQSTERAYTLRRLSSARAEIAQLEAQLLRSTQSLFGATQTLTEATDLLLEQVDTSRDDLRNQIRSAQDLADSLRTQTEGLVSARSRLAGELRAGVTPAPTPVPSQAADDKTIRSVIAVRPSDAAEPDATVLPDTRDAAPEIESTPHKLPPLGLRPAPDAEDAFLPEATDTGDEDEETPVEIPTLVIPETTTGSGGRGWDWKDMLSNVDRAVPPGDDTDAVVADLRAAGLAPEAIVDEGNAADALNTWEAAGLGAMGQLLSIRFDAPARAFRDTVRTDAELEARVRRFSEARASRLASASRAEREADAATDAGRAWLFVQAVLAL